MRIDLERINLEKGYSSGLEGKKNGYVWRHLIQRVHFIAKQNVEAFFGAYYFPKGVWNGAGLGIKRHRMHRMRMIHWMTWMCRHGYHLTRYDA